MKKLMFATALVASAAAFADPTALNAISFEGYSADATFVNGAAEKGEDGNDKTGNPFFYYDGDGDGSSVKTFATGDAGAVNQDVTRPFYFQGATPALNYLELSTEGGTLWRSINPITQGGTQEDPTYSLGAATNVAVTGTYFDTLVQFTPTEDGGAPTDLDPAADKLAIWLNVDGNGVTNLMVKAGSYDGEGALIPGGASYVLTGKTVVDKEWYRLTVKAIDNILPENEGFKIPGFQVFIDGVEMSATTSPLPAAFLATLQESEILSAAQVTELSSGKYLPSLLAGENGVASTLQAVGFKGSGALDDLVWTEEDPFTPATIGFTLTWGEGVSAVSYTFGDFSTTNSLTSGTAVQLPVGDGTAEIELIPTFASGYVFDKVTMDGEDLGLTFAIPSVTTNATLLAKLDTPAYPTYIDTTDAAIKDKYDAWKAGVGCDDASASNYEKQFLLNVDEATVVGDAALEITAITQNETAGWDITIGCSISGVGLTGTAGSAIVCNGYLAVSYTDDLTGTWTTENINITSVDATAGTVTVNVNKSGAKFMKVKLSSAAEPQN